MKLPEIFLSPASLQTAFESGLDQQLHEDSLGTFILVLANSLLDEKIFTKFKQRLQDKYELQKQKYSSTLRQGKPLHDAPDDMLVFLKLIAMGFNNLSTTEYRHTENWELQFNQLRALRPQRMSGASISRLLQDFDENTFNFNKPFLNKEVFWSGVIDGVPVKLLYNKFPFAPLHGILVPEPGENLPQFLNADMHHFTSSLCTQLGQNIPNIAIAYNSYGAGASINHLHFQTFTMQEPLPVLRSHWQHNGGRAQPTLHLAGYLTALLRPGITSMSFITVTLPITWSICLTELFAWKDLSRAAMKFHSGRRILPGMSFAVV